MRHIKSIFLLFFLIALTTLPANAKTITTTSKGFTVKAVSDVTSGNKKGIQFNITVDVPGPVKAGAWIMVTICDSRHNRVKVSGKDLMFHKSVTLPYKNNSFKGSKIFVPYSELKKGNISPTSSFSYYVTVQSKKNKSTIKQSDYIDWKGTASSKPGKPTPKTRKPAPKQNSPAPKASKKKNKSWTETYGRMVVKHTIGDKGIEGIEVTIPCIFCHESGVCQACHGLGQIWWPGLGCYQTCTMCFGEKVCPQCKGTKRHTSRMYRTPDGLYYDQNGKLIVPGDDEKGKRFKRKNCPVCDGTGVQDFPMYVDDPTGAQANVIAAHECGYQHMGNSACRYCGEHRYHVHLKCYKCN